MCHFVTGIVSGKITLEEVNAIGRASHLQFRVCQNEFVQKQLRGGEIYIEKRCNHCDCGTPLGILNRDFSNHVKRVTEADILKLKRKGWSETKIQRYLDSKNKKIEQVADGNETREWINFLGKLFAETPVKAFGILLHWYGAGTETERIGINKRVLIKKSELTANHLLAIEEDVLYIVE